MNSLKRLGLLLWYGLGLYLVLLYLQAVVVPWFRVVAGAGTAANVLGLVEALVGLAVLAGVFVLLHLAARSFPAMADAWVARATSRPAAPATPAPGEYFPSPGTVVVGVWLLAIAVVNVLALFAVIEPPPWLHRSFPSIDPEKAGVVQDMLVTMFAAGIGSTISVIFGYLEHASIKKDFDLAYCPWYVARPILGMLTGAIFYFVLKGGLLATTSGTATTSGLAAGKELMVGGQNLNDLSLAGFGALVGLFSKNALEKLKEVFNTLFATVGDAASEGGGKGKAGGAGGAGAPDPPPATDEPAAGGG